jgi:YVTN family beta-propeller protein
MRAIWRSLAVVPTALVALGLVLGWGLFIRLANPPVADEPTAAATPSGQVFVANETSGTVSVIDAATNALVDTICLGSDPAIQDTPQPNGPCNAEADHHRPLYNGHIAPHGLWLTPDGAMLVVTNRLSGTIVGIDTRTHSVLGYSPVEREPHLATVRPGGQEAWVAVRGESQLDVLGLTGHHETAEKNRHEGQRNRAAQSARTSTEEGEAAGRRGELFPKIDTVDSMLGPSMVSFTSDGAFAFVVSAKQRLVQKINAESREVVASQVVSVPFSPFGLVSPDDRELYVVHKLAGTLSILRTNDLSFVVRDLAIGPCANHVFFLGKLAYITIGGPPPCAPAGAATRQGKVVILDRTTHRIVNELSGPAFTGDPHGIWATGDGRRLFVGRESANKVTVIDTGNADNPADDVVIATLDVGKQPIDVVVSSHPAVVGP